MSDAQAHDFYKNPEHLSTLGTGQQRQGPMKSGMIPVRFAPDMIAAVKRFASQDGVTVSTWIRRLIGRELQRRQPSATAAFGDGPSVQFAYPAELAPRSETIARSDVDRLIPIL